ncbi:hypothetical protein H0A36_10930 [Endozoicomonas sp. SM1973]|uniref:Uncharacterized protein n=1 Tax=Spartinivicinus marinus TaxID=2994442 RepID=A0A853IBB8_9GAMM|nr:hypothetical protein [Spartinivicinus marinus]MCX4024832.1 hypothetical protein [Spartinivicinus marinus]NYZ66525.1 hypothetical protein [Spartinivicinus marinus]
MSKGQITFWEGNGATQDRVGNILSGGESYDIECKKGDYGFQNDEARSMKLEGVPGPTIMWVYDSPSASKDDDWAKITIIGDISDTVVVSSFNSSANLDNGNVKVESHYKNGLDGKISRIIIEYLG